MYSNCNCERQFFENGATPPNQLPIERVIMLSHCKHIPVKRLLDIQIRTLGENSSLRVRLYVQFVLKK